MWLRRDVKYHKFPFRRWSLLTLVKLTLIFVMAICVYLVQRTDLNPRGINSDLLSRILFSKTRADVAFEREIEEDLAKQVPGLCNRGVECFLTGVDDDDDNESLGDESYEANGINVMLSDIISYNRTPPDVRNDLCQLVGFETATLPSASIIIIFYEEPYSVLLRTIHSVINTAPSMLLKEVILVDDFSSFNDLKGKLNYYVRTRLPDKVKLLRLEKQ